MVQYPHCIVIHAIAVQLLPLHLGRGVKKGPGVPTGSVRVVVARREEREIVPSHPPRVCPKRKFVLKKAVIVCMEDVSDAKIGNDQVPVVSKEDVLRLEVAMDDAVLMYRVDPEQLDLVLSEILTYFEGVVAHHLS